LNYSGEPNPRGMISGQRPEKLVSSELGRITPEFSYGFN
jgi:hypothetical protein